MKKQGRNNKAGLRKLERKREVGEREREGEKNMVNLESNLGDTCNLFSLY